MASSRAKAPLKSRRLQWLAAGILVAIATYSVGWYWLAGKLETEAIRTIQNASQNGQALTCENAEARGYPFRIGLFCDAVGARLPSAGITVSAKALRSAAQIYAPNKIVTELDGPALVEAPGLAPLKLDWELLHASFVQGLGQPERVSVEARQLTISARQEADRTAPLAAIGNGQVHARLRGEALDLAASIEGMKLPGAQFSAIPEALFTLDATLPKGAALTRESTDPAHPLRGQTIELRDLTYAFPLDQASIALKGTVGIDEAGLADGAIDVKVVKPEAFGAAAHAAFPNAAAEIDPIVNGLSAIAQSGAPVTITVKKGKMSAGLFPLGELPPL